MKNPSRVMDSERRTCAGALKHACCGPQGKLAGFVLVVLFFAGAGQILASESGAIRLAVSATGGPAAELSDLLTTELAAMPGVTMLERAELDKVVREQAVTSTSSAALVKAGAVLGADGIIVLDARKLATRTWVALRIVGVRHGVALGWWDYTLKTDETVSWPKGAAAQIKQLIPKLSTPVSGSSAISFV